MNQNSNSSGRLRVNTEQSRSIKSKLSLFLGTPLTILALYFIGSIIYEARGKLFESLSHANVALLGTGIVLFFLYFFLRGYLWHKLLVQKGHTLPVSQTLFLYAAAEIKRYIPANIVSFVSRVREFQKQKVPKNVIIKLIFIEVGILLLAAFFTSLAGFQVLQWRIGSSYDLLYTFTFVTPAILAITSLLVVLSLFLFSIFFARKKLSRMFRFVTEYFDVMAFAVLTWIVFGVANFCVTAAFTYLNPWDITYISSFFILSWLVGYLSFVAPMGLGVRESLVTIGLVQFMSLPLAATLALLLRIFLILSELLFLAGSYVFYKTNVGKQFIRISPQVALVFLFAVSYSIYFSYLSIEKHLNFFTGRFDLGNMDQTVWNTLHGRIFMLTNPDSTNIISRLGIHADFLLILLAPFYLIWQDPGMLLIIQTVVIASGAFFVYLLGQDVLKNKNIALILSLSYLLNPFIQKQNLYDFHAVSLATTFLLGAFYFLNKYLSQPARATMKRVHQTVFLTLFLFFLLLAVLTKEQIFVIAAFFGALLFIKQKRQFGVIIAGISITVFYLLVAQFIPHARGGAHFALGYFQDIGDSPVSILKNLLFHPFNTLIHLITLDSLFYIKNLLTPVAGLSLLAPQYLLFALPDLTINLLSKNTNLRSINFHYAAAIIPFVYISSIFGIQKVLSWEKKRMPARAIIYGILFFSLYSSWRFGALPAAKYPSLEVFTYPAQQRSEITKYIKRIPDNLSVAATNNIGAHLSHREKIYTIPNGTTDADVVMFLLTDPYAQPSLDAQTFMVEDLKRDQNYTLVINNNPFYVFAKKDVNLSLEDPIKIP